MAGWTEIKTAYNSTFAIGGVSRSADSFVVNESPGLAEVTHDVREIK